VSFAGTAKKGTAKQIPEDSLFTFTMKYYGKKLGLGLEPSSQGVFVYKKSSLSDIVEISDIVMSINGIDVFLFNTLIIVLFLLNLCRFYDFLYLSSQHRSNNAASCRRVDVMVHMIG
jgi:hypothetical protein